MSIFSKLTSWKLLPGGKKPVFEGFPDSIMADDDQQSRMVRADDMFLYVKDISQDKTSGTVVGDTGTYSTSLSGCTCPDFQERQRPCKHMYKLAYVTQRMEPEKYYHGDHVFRHCYWNIVPDKYRSETAFSDHMSLNKYEIQAVFKPTHRKRKLLIYASSEEEATSLITDEYETPAISLKKVLYDLPSDRQIIYAVSLGISIPQGCCKEDLAALIERKVEDADWHATMPNGELIKFGKQQGVAFSLLNDEPSLIKILFFELTDERRIAFMAACLDKSLRHRWNFRHWENWLTKSKTLLADKSFMKSMNNNIDWFTGFEYSSPGKNTLLYKKLKSIL